MARIAVASVLLALALAAPASAGVLSRAADNSTVTFEDRAAVVDRIQVLVSGSDWVVDRLQGGADVTAEGTCTATGQGDGARCAAANLLQIFLGGGDDEVLLAAAEIPTLVLGGPGTDTVSFASAGVAVRASLDDGANDGPIGDARSELRGDVENLTGGSGADLLGGDGDANVLDGGAGGDEITGGAGADTLRGGTGADTIRARDGQPDVVECGADGDTVIADGSDQVAADCEAVDYPDADGDGVNAKADCDDANASIKPGATDVPGNGIDEDCSGADSPRTDTGTSPGPVAPLSVTSPIASRWSVSRRTRVLVLKVSGVPAGGRVTVTCRGGKRKGCSFKSRRVRTRKGRGDLRGLFRPALAPGALIEIRITAPGRIGKVARYRIRRGMLPSLTRLCLPAGATRPQPCG